jgi:NADPH-dependent curcumin reductase CurA
VLDHEAPHPALTQDVTGMLGLTAHMSLLNSGQPVAGETVVVGAVGSVCQTGAANL